MAERRMFAMTIIDSDDFLDMPLSTQALYFHLSMRADDDGFINNPKKIQRTIGATDGDAAMLVAKKFIIPFDTGVVVIKHWRINNYLRNDRYHETVYQEEKNQLTIKDNRAYTLKSDDGIPVGIPMVDQRYTENRIDKNRQDKNRLVECNSDSNCYRELPSSEDREVPTKGVMRASEHDAAQLFMERFNAIDGVLPCSRLHVSREIKINTLLSTFTQDEIDRAFDNLSHSDFLRGKVPGANGKAWSVTFDWFIEVSNFTKVLEGTYNNTSNSSESQEQEITPEMYLNQKGVI